jgi:hypothetical protein
MATLSAELRPHPTTPCEAIRRFTVTVDPQSPDELRIRYRIEGDIGRLRLPVPGPARRRDGLWQHSCFEAFLRPDARNDYCEFNFAPSGDWAAYRFGARREQRTSPDLRPPLLSFSRHAVHCDLTADVSLASLPELSAADALHAGLCAVIETDDGRLSCWAIAHGGERPDFHDPATFTLRVARA